MDFHIAGVIASVLILLPNLLYMAYPPEDMPLHNGKAPLWLTVVENIGRFTCLIYPIIFGADTAIAIASGSIIVYLMAAFILAYYILWARYFAHGRTFKLLFRPLFFIPVPMAVFPAAYFLILSLLLQSPMMATAAVVFAAGHIPISLMTYRQLQKDGRAV